VSSSTPASRSGWAISTRSSRSARGGGRFRFSTPESREVRRPACHRLSGAGEPGRRDPPCRAPTARGVGNPRPVAVSLLTAVSYLPWALLGLPIGAYVDRSNPAAVAAGANIGRAALLAALCTALLAGHRSLAVLYVVVSRLGVGEAAYDNAAQSLLPRVVADAALEKANSALAIVEQAGLDLAGPALGGVIFAMSAALPFGLNAIGLIIGAALIARIPVARRPAGARPSARAFLREVPAGLRWLCRSGFVRSIIVTGAALTFFTQMWVPLLVLLATGPMGLSKTGYGVMLALGAFPTPVVAALVWGDTGFTFALWNVLSVMLPSGSAGWR
jgi:MFS family permease